MNRKLKGFTVAILLLNRTLTGAEAEKLVNGIDWHGKWELIEINPDAILVKLYSVSSLDPVILEQLYEIIAKTIFARAHFFGVTVESIDIKNSPTGSYYYTTFRIEGKHVEGPKVLSEEKLRPIFAHTFTEISRWAKVSEPDHPSLEIGDRVDFLYNGILGKGFLVKKIEGYVINDEKHGHCITLHATPEGDE